MQDIVQVLGIKYIFLLLACQNKKELYPNSIYKYIQ